MPKNYQTFDKSHVEMEKNAKGAMREGDQNNSKVWREYQEIPSWLKT